MMMGWCVLIVDDDEEVGQSLAAALEGIAGVRAVVAPHGPAALRILEADNVRISALVTDLNLPHGDGLQLLRAVRRLPGYSRLPVLMITAEAGELTWDGNNMEGPDLDRPDLVLSKPFSYVEVSRVLEGMLL